MEIGVCGKETNNSVREFRLSKPATGDSAEGASAVGMGKWDARRRLLSGELSSQSKAKAKKNDPVPF